MADVLYRNRGDLDDTTGGLSSKSLQIPPIVDRESLGRLAIEAYEHLSPQDLVLIGAGQHIVAELPDLASHHDAQANAAAVEAVRRRIRDGDGGHRRIHPALER